MNGKVWGLVLSFYFTAVAVGGPVPAAPAPVASELPARIVVEVLEGTLDSAAAQKDLQQIDPKQHRIDKIVGELGKFGPVQLGTRFDGQVTPGRQTDFMSGQKIPIVTGNKAIEYMDTGTICGFSLREPVGSQGYRLTGHVEWSGVVSSNIKISANVNASIVIKTKMELSCQAQPGIPLLFSTTTKVPDQAKVQIIIFRITLFPLDR